MKLHRKSSRMPVRWREALQNAVQTSRKRTIDLEGHLFDQAAALFPSVDIGKYFMVSADAESGLFFAPVSNIPREILCDILKVDKGALLNEIRNRFPLPVGGRGFIADIIRRLLEYPGDVLDGILLEIDAQGEICLERFFTKDGSDLKDDSSLGVNTRQDQKLAPRLQLPIKQMRGALASDKTYFFARKGASINFPTSRPFSLVQIGFLFTERDLFKLSVLAGCCV